MTTASWLKGQNSQLPVTRVTATVAASAPLDLAALLVTAAGRVRTDTDLVFHGHPASQGVTLHPATAATPPGTAGQARQPHPGPAVAVDLAEVPADVARVVVVASLDDGSGTGLTFGRLPAPVAHLDATGGGRIGSFVMTGLERERAIVALELYRRGGGWKVRAVGQGYAGGLAELVTAFGIEVDPDPAPPRPPTLATPGPGAVAPPITVPAQLQPAPPGVDLQQRRYDQLWGIFEDAARSAAAFRSAADFATERLDRDLSALVADPATRVGAGAEAARRDVQRRHDELVARARADRGRDTAQLLTELAEVGADLAAPMSPWESPSWSGWRPPAAVVPAVRLGELHLADQPQLRIPYLLRLPQRRPLGIEAAAGAGQAAARLAHALTVRLLAAHPVGALTVQVVDLAGRGGAAADLEPLLSSGTGVVAPPVGSPAGLTRLLDALITRVDLARMAAEGGAGDLGSAATRTLVVLHGFPLGLDERGMLGLRLLVEAGGGAGVDLLLVADPADVAAAGQGAEAVWQAAHRLPPVPDDCMGDPWVGLVWTFVPDPPAPPAHAAAVLAGLAASAGHR